MSKNLIIVILALAVLAACAPKPKNQFTITGTIDTVFDGKIYLQERTESNLTSIDSAQLANGNFAFHGTIDYPEVYYLTIPATKSSVPFFLEPSRITVNINTKSINKTKISGSTTQEAYEHYLDNLDQFNDKIRENYQMYNKAQELGDQEKIKHFDSLLTSFEDQRSKFSKNYVLQNTKSFISPYIVYRNSYDYDLEELQNAYNAFDTALYHSLYSAYIKAYISVLKRTAVGQKYVPFDMLDTSGTNVSLADLIGHGYLLVDFWASWCSPCRQENPNIVRLYNIYHDKGFDILGVSLDSKKERWLDAIAKDHLDWTHVSDLTGWDNMAARLYGVRSIPSNVLFDTTGTIIDRNLRGEDLANKLAELFPAGEKSR